MERGEIQTVVQGEASESDEEETQSQQDDDSSKHVFPRGVPQRVVVSGEASESDEEDDTTRPTFLPLRVSSEAQGDEIELSESEPTSPSSVKSVEEPKYDTLLHMKLREKNVDFRNNLCATIGQVYLSSAREIRNITQQLSKSQIGVQDVSHNMRLLTNDLFHLEDKIDIISSCNLLPIINLPVSPTPAAEAELPVSPPGSTTN